MHLLYRDSHTVALEVGTVLASDLEENLQDKPSLDAALRGHLSPDFPS